MKNAGIITFHCADNYGAVLQVYALQKMLQQLNIDAEIIDFRPKELTIPYNHSFNFYKNYKSKGLMRTIKLSMSKIYKYRDIKRRLDSFSDFRKQNLKLSNESYAYSKDLCKNPPLYDFYVTGSDQVWNPHYIMNIGYSYFLDFVNSESVKISYAASIAQDVEEELVEEYKKQLSEFNYISIREESSVDFLRQITDKDIKVTLDPTLLLDKQEWGKISKSPNLGEKYILVYDLIQNNELIKIANQLSSELGMRIISYSNKRNYINSIESFHYRGPSEFLGLFEKAEFVLTNSFHGTVFAVINNKPFYTIPHNKTGSRMVDLLKNINLDDRIVYQATDLKGKDYSINYKEANKLLDNKRKDSIDFLMKSFETREE